MKLFIPIFLCFQVAEIAVSSSKSCVYQVKTRIVQSGGSVIIPCSYNDPGKLDEEKKIEVHWWEGNETTCWFTSNGIFSSSGKVDEKYDGRLSTWKDPNRNRTLYIEITGLKPTDGPLFCCQITVNSKNSRKVLNNQQGTLLQYSDKQFATQLDELIAIPGEDIIIPCHYPKIVDSVRKVTWKHVSSNTLTCVTDGTEIYSSSKQYQNRYSLVNSHKDVSLRIQKANVQDQGHYCCAVTNTKEILSKQVTTLLVADPQPFKTRNSPEITGQKGGSVNLTCSYALPVEYTESDVLRANVYWRVGNVTGLYAYHPYQEMVHSRYINRTNITGTANLQIKGVKTEDNTTFHCFVAFKVCKDDNQNKDKIVYGGETRLIVKGIPAYEKSPTEGTMPRKEFPTYLIIIIFFSVIIMVIIILILIVLKVKGAFCRRKGNISEQQMNTIHATGDELSNDTRSCETSSKKPDEVSVVGMDNVGRTVEDEDDKLLYAKLDKTKLNDKSRAQRPKHSEEVVYADVVNAAQI